MAAFAAGCEEGVLPFADQAGQVASEPAVEPQPCTDPPNHDAVVQELLDSVNMERAKRLLPPLRMNPTLMQVADFYACRLIDGKFFDHVDPYDGSTVDTRATDFGYAFVKIGENLAGGHPTVKAAMAEWLESPTHRANLLDPTFTEMGIAVKVGGEFGRYWVQEFGRPVVPTTMASTSAADPVTPVKSPEGSTVEAAAGSEDNSTTAPASSNN
jgi:uncharacterized protein YkwD